MVSGSSTRTAKLKTEPSTKTAKPKTTDSSTRTALLKPESFSSTAKPKTDASTKTLKGTNSSVRTAKMPIEVPRMRKTSRSQRRTDSAVSSPASTNRTAMSPYQHNRKPTMKDLPVKPFPKLPSLDQLKKEIPPHIFKIDDNIGYFNFAKDFGLAAVGYIVLLPLFEGFGGWIGLFLWYWVMGIFGCALFCLGHDAVHGTVINNWVVNDILGHCVMSSILIPFYPWRSSHRHHHAHTNNVDRDTVHPFYTEDQWFDLAGWYRTAIQSPIQQFFMFMPVYLLFGWADGTHYLPIGKLYSNNTERVQGVISALSCVFCGYLAYLVCGGFFPWFKYYMVPVFFSGLFINLMTLMNHVDVDLTEGYAEEEWGYVRGQLQTIDREWGFGVDELWHHVPDGHFLHHLFQRVPSYNLPEGTEYLKKALKHLEGTQYAYKRVDTRDWPLRMFMMPYQADYLVEKYRNIFYYHRRVEREEREEKEKAQKAIA